MPKARTETLPRLTRTSVPLQRSSVSHFVPRTVAAPCRPRVRKRPLPSPHRRRTRLADALALPALGHLSAPVRASWVIGLEPPVWVILNWPCSKLAVWVAPPGAAADVT